MTHSLDAARADRLVLAQAHVSGLLFVSAALLGDTAWRLTHLPPGWPSWAALPAAAAVLALIAAVGPWIWRQTVRGQRWFMAATLVAGGLIAWFPGVDYRAVLACQVVLAAAILSEVGTHRTALTWFWGCVVALVVPALIYAWLVVPRPVPD
jgi:hypothetical protein